MQFITCGGHKNEPENVNAGTPVWGSELYWGGRGQNVKEQTCGTQITDVILFLDISKKMVFFQYILKLMLQH